MPIFGQVAGAGGVASRLSNVTISVTSSPSTAEVEAWLDEAEAEILSALRAKGFATTFTDPTSAGYLAIRKAAVEYAVGQLLSVLAMKDIELAIRAEASLEAYGKFIALLRNYGGVQIGVEMAGGPVGVLTRSHVLDDDYVPAVFTRGMDW